MPGPESRWRATRRWHAAPCSPDSTTRELDAVAERMRPRQFAAGEELCQAGDPERPDLADHRRPRHWLAPTTAGGGEIVLRHAQGRRDRRPGRDHRRAAHRDGRGEHRRRRRSSSTPRTSSTSPERYPADPDQRHPDAARAACSRASARQRARERARRGDRPRRRTVAEGRAAAGSSPRRDAPPRAA